jgi:hypothetical protein
MGGGTARFLAFVGVSVGWMGPVAIWQSPLWHEWDAYVSGVVDATRENSGRTFPRCAVSIGILDVVQVDDIDCRSIPLDAVVRKAAWSREVTLNGKFFTRISPFGFVAGIVLSAYGVVGLAVVSLDLVRRFRRRVR